MSLFLLIFALVSVAQAATKNKPHGHNGVLHPYDGKHMSYNITAEQLKKLNSGKPVTLIAYLQPLSLHKSIFNRFL